MKIITIIKKANFVKFLRGLSLLLVSILLSMIAGALALITTPLYYLIRFEFQKGLNHMGDYMTKIAVSIEKLCNIYGASVLQLLLIKRGGYLFGDPEETITYVIAKNRYMGKLNFLGKLVYKLIERIAPGTLRDSIHNKVISDQEAVLRIQEDKYFSE